MKSMCSGAAEGCEPNPDWRPGWMQAPPPRLIEGAGSAPMDAWDRIKGLFEAGETDTSPEDFDTQQDGRLTIFSPVSAMREAVRYTSSHGFLNVCKTICDRVASIDGAKNRPSVGFSGCPRDRSELLFSDVSLSETTPCSRLMPYDLDDA